MTVHYYRRPAGLAELKADERGNLTADILEERVTRTYRPGELEHTEHVVTVRTGKRALALPPATDPDREDMTQ